MPCYPIKDHISCKCQRIKEQADIYEKALRAIAGLDKPLTGEDATCFQIWAEEALEAGGASR